MKLYEIANQYQSIMADIETCEELSVEQLDAIDAVSESMEDKAKAVAAVIKNMEVDYNAIKDAALVMEERAARVAIKVDSLKAYLKDNLERCKIDKINSDLFDIHVRKNPLAVVVNDEQLIPREYFKETISTRLDKTLLSQLLKNNVMIPGVCLQQKTRLEIR